MEMNREPLALPWDDPTWQARAGHWMIAAAQAQGYAPTGAPVWVHFRAWSAFAQLPTARGTLYFKAPAPPPLPHFEARLTAALARWRPDCTVPLVAIEDAEGWMLSADGGVAMNTNRDPAWQFDIWLKVLPFNAAFQLDMVEHVPALLALGVPDRRLERLPALYAALLEDEDNLRVGQPEHLTAAEHKALLAKRSEVADMCEALAGYGLPETLAHEEANDNNLLLDGEQVRFIDWSEGSIAHPFFTMVNTLRTVSDRLGFAPDSAALRQLREAYLARWTLFGAPGQLSEAFDIAYRLGMVNRALSWQLGTGQLAEQHKAPYVYAVSAWLQDFLHGDGIG